MAILQQNWKEMIKPTSINVEYIGDDKNKAIIEQKNCGTPTGIAV